MYYLQIARKERGPYSREQLDTFLSSGQARSSTLIRAEGEERWVRLDRHPDFSDAGPAGEVLRGDWRVEAAALPTMMMLVGLLHLTGLYRWVPLIQMGLHELGHSMTGWLAARFMLPLPYLSTSGDGISTMIFLMLSGMVAAAGHRHDQRWLIAAGGVMAAFFGSWFFFDARNPVIFLLVAGGAALIGAAGLRGRSPLLVGLAGLVLLTQLSLTFFIGEERYTTALYFNGVAGEFVLGALLVMAFHSRLPEPLRWGVLRWPALFAGVLSLLCSTLDWLGYRSDPASLPLGTAIGGRGDSGGDLNYLVSVWGQAGMIQGYLTLAVFSWVAVGAFYLYAVIRRLRR